MGHAPQRMNEANAQPYTQLLAEALIDASADALVGLSTKGQVLAWNPAAERLFGHSRAEAMGRQIFALLALHEAEEQERRRFERALELGTATFDAVYRTIDGSPVDVEVSLRCIAGERNGVAGVAMSVRALADAGGTDRPIADRGLHGLLESTPDAMIMVDQLGRIVLVNTHTQELFGYRREELLGQAVEQLLPTRYRGQHAAHRTDYFKSPRARPMGAGLELFGRRKDGTEFPAEISLGPIETSRGLLVTAAVRDVTERKRLEDDRRRSLELESRMKSEFLANMSHELRTPLNAIIGFTKLMYHGKVGPVSPRHREYLGDILKSSDHLLQLINDVLDLAKVEAGRMEFRPEPIDLATVLGEVRDIVRGVAAAKHIRLEMDVDPEVQGVELDPSKLKQVLYNYVSNAVKFTAELGRVVIRVKPEGADAFRIEVEDNGIGIRSEDLERLFTEFRQIDDRAAKQYQGTGLGLALTKRIVEAQGGQVGVVSRRGMGSTFYAVLPRVSPVVGSPRGEDDGS